jgi:hypothetical protein
MHICQSSLHTVFLMQSFIHTVFPHAHPSVFHTHSLSLVFALHHYKPTPLYVMDEIDAALGVFLRFLGCVHMCMYVHAYVCRCVGIHVFICLGALCI